jgi:hypothetical protein
VACRALKWAATVAAGRSGVVDRGVGKRAGVEGGPGLQGAQAQAGWGE